MSADTNPNQPREMRSRARAKNITLKVLRPSATRRSKRSSNTPGISIREFSNRPSFRPRRRAKL